MREVVSMQVVMVTKGGSSMIEEEEGMSGGRMKGKIRRENDKRMKGKSEK